MKNKQQSLCLFKLEYSWYEGEYDSVIFAAAKDKDEIEKDLKEANEQAKIEENNHNVDCLPTKYQEIIAYLEKKGYIICDFINNKTYAVEDGPMKDNKHAYIIQNKEITSRWRTL